MTPVAVPLENCFGFDCNTKLDEKSAARLAASTFGFNYQEHPLEFAIRYVFYREAVPGDLSAAETDAILGAGLRMLVVQHVRNPGWTASEECGASDGQWAARNAAAAGYLAGCHLALDLEGVANSGHRVSAHAVAWATAVRDGGFLPVIYVGYQCGLTPDELWELPNVDRYWSDFGTRHVSNRGFCCQQFKQQIIAGVEVDPDHAYPDALGGTLVAMGVEPDSVA